MWTTCNIQEVFQIMNRLLLFCSSCNIVYKHPFAFCVLIHRKGFVPIEIVNPGYSFCNMNGAVDIN